MSAPKCSFCDKPAVCVDYVDGVETFRCAGCKPKKLTAIYTPNRETIEGQTRIIGRELVTERAPFLEQVALCLLAAGTHAAAQTWRAAGRFDLLNARGKVISRISLG